MSTHPVFTRKDNWPMSSKLFTTVLAMITIVPFSLMVGQDAVKVTDTLHTQTSTIQKLNAESEQLEKKLETKKEVKQQVEQEVVKTEQQVNDIVSERQKLEAEAAAMGVN